MADNIVIKRQTLNIQVSSLGTGETIPTFVSGGKEILFKTIRGNGIVEVSTLPNNTISVSSIAITNVSSLGTGIQLYQNVSANKEINFRTFSSSVYIYPYTSGNNIKFTFANSYQIIDTSGNISEPILYTFSTARSSSKLTLETTTVIFARSGSLAANSYIFHSGITSNLSRLPMPFNGRIIRATGNITSNLTSTKKISIFVDNTEYTSILNFPVTTAPYYSINNNINIIVSAGRGISTIVRGGTGRITNPVICLWIKFEIP